jgi:hypothetical protein
MVRGNYSAPQPSNRSSSRPQQDSRPPQTNRGTSGGRQGAPPPPQEDKRSVGAFWVNKTKKDGKEFFGGNLEVGKLLAAIEELQLQDTDKLDIVAFWNEKKQSGDRSPDINIKISETQKALSNQDDQR